jgi:hypothetical protein
MDQDAEELGIAVDAVEGGSGPIESDGDVLDDYLPGLRIVASVDEEALVFIAEIITEDAFDAVAFLLDDQFREVIIMNARHVDVSVAIPGAGNSLSGEAAIDGEEGTYID